MVPPQDAVPDDGEPGRGPDRRRLLAFAGAALAAGGGLGGAALLRRTEKDGRNGDRGAAPPAKSRWARGRLLWTRTVGDLGSSGRVLRHGGALLITDAASVTALDAATGAVRWRHPARDVTAVRPLGDQVLLLLSGLLFAPELLALDARTGNRRWSALPDRPRLPGRPPPPRASRRSSSSTVGRRPWSPTPPTPPCGRSAPWAIVPGAPTGSTPVRVRLSGSTRGRGPR